LNRAICFAEYLRMLIRRRAALLAALLLFVLAAPAARAGVQDGAPPATPAPRTPADLLGIVVRDPWYEFGTSPGDPDKPNYQAQNRMGQILAEAGVRWVRVEFIVRQGAGSWQEQIARNDYFINDVAPRYGLKVMGLLGFALVDIDPRDPKTGLVAPTTTDPAYGGGVNPWMRDWLDRALFVAQRYGSRVAAYEILNEQNRLPVVPASGSHPGYPGGEGIDPALAARLHTKFYRCFRQNACSSADAAPAWRAGVTVILGGLHPRGSDSIVPKPAAGQPQKLDDRQYLRALYTSEPFTSYFSTTKAYPVDGLGYHPYPVEIALSLDAVEGEAARIDARLGELRATLRATLNAVAPTAAEVPFWITEIGYNAGYMRQNSAGQAAFLRAVFRTMAARDDVAAVFWFKYEDFPPAAGPDAQQWGIVRIPFTPGAACPGGACYDPTGEPAFRRAAFFAMRELAGLPVLHTAMPLVAR
jgi:hypothetical protein